MIPVKPAPEPSTFNKKVREPGRDFLKNLGITKQGDVADNIPWDKARFWAKCYKELDSAYNYICCYVGMRINNSSNRFESHSVEHFIPKSINPWLAYEWDNYRLACRKANSDRDKKPVIDPFLVGPDDFRLDLFTQKLFPNPILSKQKQQEVKDTIDNIDLNCDYWVKNRQNYYCEYLKMESEEEGRKYLQKKTPRFYSLNFYDPLKKPLSSKTSSNFALWRAFPPIVPRMASRRLFSLIFSGR